MHAHTHIHVHTHARAYIHTYTYARTHTQTHTHTTPVEGSDGGRREVGEVICFKIAAERELACRMRARAQINELPDHDHVVNYQHAVDVQKNGFDDASLASLRGHIALESTVHWSQT